MERCPNCDGRLSKIDVLCPRCGTVVEVIQIKSSISSAPEAAAEQKANTANDVQKKEFPENFIVYNEDFPSEETAAEPEAAQEPPVIEAAELLPDAAPAEEPVYVSEAISESAVPEQPLLQESAAEKHVQDDMLSGGEYENDYSERYLEHLKNLNLPEIDDIQSFDPEEFMRQYRDGKASEQEPESPDYTPETKRWLEIEEACESDAAPEESAKSASAVTDTDSLPERRYRSKERRRSREKSASSERRSKEKKQNAAIAVLVWLVVAAALFLGFMYFDNYVQNAYGSYDSFIYTITDGKIDLDTTN